MLHVVVDGPWGTTRAVEALVRGHTSAGRMAAMLVLRRSPSTTCGRLAALAREGLPVRLLPYKPNLWMMWRLRQLCREQRPDVLFAHGYSVHLWTRYAALTAGIPHIVHVEHNREDYPVQRLRQNRWLAGRTDRIVCVANGITDRLRALARLAGEGCHPSLMLAGGGKAKLQAACAALAESLGIARQVTFLGVRQDVPELLMRTKIMVLSSPYEGMPLAVLEGMAAGCAVVASDIPGVREVVDHDRTGLLFSPGDATALAAALKDLLGRPDRAQTVGAAAARQIAQHHSLAAMVDRYDALTGQLLELETRR